MSEREKDEGISYWQVSDIVPSDVITVCTGSCDRNDCDLSAKYMGGTMLGTSQHYDKAGNLKVSDQNRMAVSVTCGTCWRGWGVHRGLRGENTVAKEIKR